jgi:hypothetical protein
MAKSKRPPSPVKPSVNGPQQAAERTSPFAEVGSTGLRRFGYGIQEEFDPALRGPRGVKVFEEMRRNDPDVGAVLFAVNNVALQAGWEIEAASEEQADEDAAEFVRTALFSDMSHTWEEFLLDALTCLVYGWAYFELVYKQRLGPDRDPPSQYDDGRIGLRKIAIRGQESLVRWEFDEEGGIQGMRQRAWPKMQDVLIPIEKSLLVRTSREKNNPEGYSLLRNAYKPYYLKRNLEEIELIGAERDMTGVLKVYLPANASDQDKNTARDMGERYKMDDQAYFILQRFGPEPQDNWEIDVVKTPGQKVVDTDKAIQRYSIQIARSVLAQFLTLGQGRVGSYALSKSQQDLFHLAVKGLLDTFEGIFNRFLVAKLFKLNVFEGMTALPRLVHSDLGDIDLDQLTKFLQVTASLGFVLPTREVIAHLHRRGGLPEPPEEGEEVEEVAQPSEKEVPSTAREWGEWYMA